MSKMRRLSGMIGIEITPFKANGEIDEESYRRLIDYMVENGNRAVITCGNISEGNEMTVKQCNQLLDITLDQVSDKIPVIHGCMKNTTALQMELAKHAKDAGAYGVLSPVGGYAKYPVVPGVPKPDEIIYNHYSAMAKLDLEIMAYDTVNENSMIPTRVFTRLVNEFSNIRHAKATDQWTKIVELLRELGDKLSLFCPIDTMLVPLLQLGCKGGTNSTPVVIPACARKVYEAAERKDWHAVTENWQSILPVIHAIYHPQNDEMRSTQMAKEALYMMGIFDSVNYCNPRPPSSEKAIQTMRQALTDLGVKLVR